MTRNQYKHLYVDNLTPASGYPNYYPPPGRVWLVISTLLTLTLDLANTGTRDAYVEVYDRANNVGQVAALAISGEDVTTAGSGTGNFLGFGGMQNPQTLGNSPNLALLAASGGRSAFIAYPRPIPILPGWAITVNYVGLQSGDSFSFNVEYLDVDFDYYLDHLTL